MKDQGSMKRLERIKNLFSLGEYLRRVAYFVVLGAAIFLSALIVKDPFWNDVLVQLSLVFIAVGLVSIVWDIVGGDPMELQMVRLFSNLDTKVISIQRSMGIISDIIEGNIGIERIWSTRREWESDPEDGLSAWKERMCLANKVDVVSNTFWTRWVRRGISQEVVQEH